MKIRSLIILGRKVAGWTHGLFIMSIFPFTIAITSHGYGFHFWHELPAFNLRLGRIDILFDPRQRN